MGSFSIGHHFRVCGRQSDARRLRISKDTQSFQGPSVELLQLINIAEFGF